MSDARRATEWMDIGVRIETASHGWFLALCLDCEPLLEQPFRDQAERDDWRTQHGTGTGHRVVAIDCAQNAEPPPVVPSGKPGQK